MKKVSIIIPYKDQIDLLTSCVNSIKNNTLYENYEIICVNNNSISAEAEKWKHETLKIYPDIKIYDLPIPFNFSKINNIAVNEWASGSFVVFMNSDIEIISENWIEQMIHWASSDNVGCVGARLYYPDNKVQHAGVTLNQRGMPIHINHNVDRFSDVNIQSKNGPVSAVTGAFLCVEKSKFLQVKGFDEELAVSYNDIDLCLRLNDIGLNSIYLATCEAYHHESKTRGYENNPEKQKRLALEQDFLLQRHGVLSKKFYSLISRKKRVLFISATARNDRPYLDPSTRYRCYYPADELTRDGYLVDILSYEKFNISIIDRYDVFVFHRPSWGEKLQKAISEIKKNLKFPIASYDDLIFGEKYAEQSSIVKSGRATLAEAISIFINNEKALKLFDKFIASTDCLADKIKEHSNGDVFVSYNALDRKTVASAAILNKYRLSGLAVPKVITYLSGTKSHDADFAVVKAALDKIKTERANEVDICIVGPLDFQNTHGFTRIGHVEYEQLGKITSLAYLNIAPLEMNDFTKCKSGLKFYESAIYRVPSIVSPIPDMIRFESCKGLNFAYSEEEWYLSINKFLDDPVYRDNMAELSYQYALKHCTMSDQFKVYKKLIEAL